jgi:transcriptional regulator of acetoin/glycerol metabolism
MSEHELRQLAEHNPNFLWTPGMTLALLEREALRQALTHFSGNCTAAAEELEIPLSTFYRKLKKQFTAKERAAFRASAKRWWD